VHAARRGEGTPLLVAEHDPDMVRSADHHVAVGPGAGPDGGAIVAAGPLPDDPLGRAPASKAQPRVARGHVRLRGATLHNLRGADLDVHLGTFQVVRGRSGAGKSSLVFGTLVPALSGEDGGPFASLEGAEEHRVRALDARPIGRTSRSTPATWSGLMDLLRKRFAATDGARERGMGASRFSFNAKEGRCAECEGLGTQRVGLHLLEDVELPCPACGGSRYAPETLEVTLRGQTVADVLAMSVAEARAFFEGDAPAQALCRAMDDLGLGYLPLGFPSNRLSRGEGQRVRLATILADPNADPTLLALDEPDRGLHPLDVERLLACIGELVDAGHTVLAISHHRSVWAAADVLVEVEDGLAREAAGAHRSKTPPSQARNRPPRPPALPPETIELRGVRTHNLAGIDATIPRGSLTALCGVSGSGKSSLAFGTLASEGWHRFAESLPFQVRRHLKRLPRADLDGASGLGPVLALRQGGARAGARSTVATLTEIGPTLRLLWSRAGTIDGVACALSAEHFSSDRAAGACRSCAGTGHALRCDPSRLVTRPDLPLTGGAMDGTRVGRYLAEPDGQFVATLRAAGPDVDWDRPWDALSEGERALALEGGSGEVLTVRWELTGTKRTGEAKDAHEFEATWDGFLALAEREAGRRARQKSAAQWAEPLVDVPCEACGGARLNARSRSVLVGDLSLPAALGLPLDGLVAALESLEVDGAAEAAMDALLPEVRVRVDDLRALGLGHLTLARASRTLSAGELQRVRLASVLRSGLTGVTLVLDEPTLGLHARDVDGLVALLRGYRDRGNTVVVVEHEPRVLRAADHLVELGPGAGADGGRIVGAGPPEELLAGDGPTASALRRGPAPSDRPPRAGPRIRRRGRAPPPTGLD
ncbi:MAG: hypothetical protein AAGB93_25400, partial [Planctomycetota bacterium]